MLTFGVVSRVILAVGLQAGREFLLQGGAVLRLRIPIHVKRLDFCAQEMIRATGAEFR